MNRIIILLAVAFFGTLTACNKMQMSNPTLSTDDDKTVYAIGVDMGTRIKTLDLSKNEMAMLKMGIDDGASSTKPQVELKTYIPKVGEMLRGRQKKFAEKEAKESEAFMKKAEASGTKTESGLVYVEKKAGSGESPKASDRVKVNYHGTLRGGDVFDSTKDRGQPATFRLDRVIKCWTEGVQKMKVGGVSELYCPAALAYGDRGAPPKIPPGSALKFEVELLEIVKGDAKPAAPAKKK